MVEAKKNEFIMVFMDNIVGIKSEMTNIAISEKIGFVSSGNVLITSFESCFTKKEIFEYFKNDGVNKVGRNFFIIEPDGESINFSDEDILEKLLSVFKVEEEVIGSNNEIEMDVNSLTKSEKELIINEILDKGDDLTEENRLLLNKLGE